MADNIAITEGSGKTIATDDVSGVHIQKVKLVDGTTDSTTIVATSIGTKTNALRIAPANDITDGTYIGDIKFGEGLAAGTNAVGKLAANTGVDIGDVDVTSISAGDNNIGNVDIVTLPAGNLGQKAMAASLSIVPASDVADTTYIGDIKFGEAIPAGTAIIGAVKRDIVNYTKVWKYVALSATTETTIWDPTGGTKFVITDIMVSASAAGTCTLRDNTAGSTIWIASLAANGGFVSNLQTPIQSATADNILTAQASAATQYVLVSGYEV